MSLLLGSYSVRIYMPADEGEAMNSILGQLGILHAGRQGRTSATVVGKRRQRRLAVKRAAFFNNVHAGNRS
jgi:hypothetical protein